MLLSLSYWQGIIPTAVSRIHQDQPYGRTVPNITPADNCIDNAFTPPEKISMPLFPVIFVRTAVQSVAQQRISQSKISYNDNNDLFDNHPITIYKISLSAHTSDG
jgi:hypothetical protein